MVILHPKCFVVFVRGTERIIIGSGDPAEIFILKSGSRDQCHVISTGIMIFIMQTAWIGKMCVDTAEFFCFFVHQYGKVFVRTCDMLCDGVGTFVSRRKHQSVKCFFYGQNLVFCSGNAAAAVFDGMGCVIGKSDLFVQVTVLQCQKSCHDLCDAGWIIFFFNILGIQDHAGIGFHDDGRFCVDRRTCRPVFPGVGFDLFIVSSLHFRFDIDLCGTGT